MNLASIEGFADLWLLNERARRECLLVVIERVKPYNVYVDESIQYETLNNQGRKLYAVTAYVATFDRWLELGQRWKEIPRVYGSPPFHFTDFMARRGDYICLEWCNTKRDDYIATLAATADEHTIMGCGVAIAEDDYVEGIPLDLREKWKDPYYFCIYGVLELIAYAEKRLNKVLPKPLYFLFEERKKFAESALKLFSIFKNRPQHAGLFGYAAFGPKKEFIPLQAADLLVGVVNRRFKEMKFNLPYKMEKPLDRLFRSRDVFISFPTKEILQRYAEFLRTETEELRGEDE
jgi:Protein of unknown function (DUF3800)